MGRRGVGEPLVARAAARRCAAAGGRGGGGSRRRVSPGATRVSERTIAVWDSKVRIRVHSRGSGPPLVFLHGPWGHAWDPFLDELAKNFTVHAPEHPGTTPDAH